MVQWRGILLSLLMVTAILLVPAVHAENSCSEIFDSSWIKEEQNYLLRLGGLEKSRALGLRHRIVRDLIVGQNILFADALSTAATLEAIEKAKSHQERTVQVVNYIRTSLRIYREHLGFYMDHPLNDPKLHRRIEEEVKDSRKAQRIFQTILDLDNASWHEGTDIILELFADTKKTNEELLKKYGQFSASLAKKIQAFDKTNKNRINVQFGIFGAGFIGVGSSMGTMTQLSAHFGPSGMVAACLITIASGVAVAQGHKILKVWANRRLPIVKFRAFMLKRAMTPVKNEIQNLPSVQAKHPLDIEFEEAWEDWKRDRLSMSPMNEKQLTDISSQQSQLALLIEEIGRWELPNGETFQEALKDSSLINETRVQEIQESGDRKLLQISLLEEEIQAIELHSTKLIAKIDAEIAQGSLDLESSKSLLTQKVVAENSLTAMSVFKRILSQNKDQVLAAQMAVESGEKIFREFLEMMAQ